MTSGLFDREVLIYHRHVESSFFTQIFWLTYGFDDAECARALYETGQLSRAIKIIPCPRWLRFSGRFSSALYSLLLPITVRKIVPRCDVLKTNQMDGSIPALICALIWKIPLYVRTGYTLTRVIRNNYPRNWFRWAAAWMTEYLALRFASVTSVSSRYDRDYLVRRYCQKISRPDIVENYVDTDLFSSPYVGEKFSNRILYVGRLSPEKNLGNAIEACASVGLELDVIGVGSELPRLAEVVVKSGARVRWLGVIPNKQLPKMFQSYRYFILPSLWEGLPKALIEAMSAGLVCIGNNTTGINEVIEDGITGYLSSSPNAESIADAIRRALSGDFERVSRAGRDFACSRYSLDTISGKEMNIFNRLLTFPR